MNRQQSLIETNLRWLEQARRLVERLDDRTYSTSPRGFEPHRAGGHMRHVLEFYDCFLNGLPSGYVDYDARRRDAHIETSCVEAAQRIDRVAGRLQSGELDGDDMGVMVRIEDADRMPVMGAWMPSSVSRELQVLASHTIHHFALIAMTLRAHGVEVDPAFGVAPATLSYAKGTNRKAAA
ncbi:MAG: hypothetical protein SFV18_00520 [Bryobacteraceae bacterium]|nr:hypothetical protein [Bryobacteraceae bacterium]